MICTSSSVTNDDLSMSYGEIDWLNALMRAGLFASRVESSPFPVRNQELLTISFRIDLIWQNQITKLMNRVDWQRGAPVDKITSTR